MAVDLFSLVLTSSISWGIQRLLDTVYECLCGESAACAADNSSFNRFVCPKCHHSLDQYLHATSHTLNPNNSIVSAHVSRLGSPRRGKPGNEFLFDLDVINCKNQQIVVELIFSEFRGSVFEKKQLVFKPRRHRTRWKNLSVELLQKSIPQKVGAMACDALVYNVWGDKLHHTRKIGELRQI